MANKKRIEKGLRKETQKLTAENIALQDYSKRLEKIIANLILEKQEMQEEILAKSNEIVSLLDEIKIRCKSLD